MFNMLRCSLVSQLLFDEIWKAHEKATSLKANANGTQVNNNPKACTVKLWDRHLRSVIAIFAADSCSTW